MSGASDDILGLYDFDFPAELVAQAPASPRDSARLLIYDRATGDVSFDIFSNITQYLPKDAVLVFNQTKVIPARMQLTKSTGAKLEMLYLGNSKGGIRVMASGKIAAGNVLNWEDGHSFTVEENNETYALLKPSFPMTQLYELLDAHGKMPIPMYLKDSPLSEEERRREFQTVFARERGSVAAPTAGLHFTPELLQRIEDHGCDIKYVTLHVNLGTFAVLREDDIVRKKLHKEAYSIHPDTADFLNEAKEQFRPIIAVGTTVVRALESAVVAPPADSDDIPRLERLSGVTDLFMTEDDLPLFAESIITNFHVPRSSLLMLVSSFTGREKLMEIYEQAVEEKMRLFSFGDGMMVL